MKRALTALSFFLAVSWSAAALAAPATVVDGARVRLVDILPSVARDVADTDLGPAPPPGGTRLFSKDELVRLVEDAGVDPKGIPLPANARVVRSALRLAPSELEAQAKARLAPDLPAGVRLVGMKSRRGVVVGKAASLSAVKLPKLPRRVGQVTLTATAEFSDDGAVVARVPLSVVLELAERATEPLIARGARVELVIEQGSTRVSASALAMADANRGDTVTFKVESTRKVLRARVESETRARVVAQ
ncbi:MAG: flagella basal body P-ring formation protein FlgA [Polyangiaceae bacterium]